MKSKFYQEIHEQPAVLDNVIKTCSRQAPVLWKRLSGRPLYLLGTGASLNACAAAQYAFLAHGMKTSVVPACSAPLFFPAMEKDALAILVSQSGDSFETAQLIVELKRRHIETWGVTNNPESQLARGADRVLELYAGEEISSATKTYTASVLLLYLTACGGDPDTLEKLARIPDDMDKTLSIALEPVTQCAEELAHGQGGFIAGAGSHDAVARQAALVIKEKTYLHFEGMSLSELRHGTVEAIGPGSAVFLSGTGKAGMQQLTQHGEYLAGIGADVYTASECPVPSLAKGRCFPVANRVGELYSHLAYSAPFQLLACLMTEKLEYDPDSFRHLQKVVSSYEVSGLEKV